MKKFTLKEIKNYISLNLATDATSIKTLPECYDKIGYSTGMYGINGGLYKDIDGNLYAITRRSTNLFRIF